MDADTRAEVAKALRAAAAVLAAESFLYHATPIETAASIARSAAAAPAWTIEVAFDGHRSSTIEAVQRSEALRKHVLGSLEITWTPQAAVVSDIRVRAQVARKGVATSMYEEAAKIAASRGLPLRSDTGRYPGAEGFWKKQVAKNRATATPVGPNKVGLDPEKIRYYQLNYPPPSSLR